MNKRNKLKSRLKTPLGVLIIFVPIICLCVMFYETWSFYVEYNLVNKALITGMRKNPNNPKICNDKAEYLYWLDEKYEPLITGPLLLMLLWFIIVGTLGGFSEEIKKGKCRIRRNLGCVCSLSDCFYLC